MKWWVIGLIGIVVIAVFFVFSKPAENTQKDTPSGSLNPTEIVSTVPTQNTNQTESMNTTSKKLEKPVMQIDSKKQYQGVFKTSAGEITVDLFASKTPITVNNFVYLANQKFYDNTIFHRVIKGFMIQGGDPLGNGTGGPGYQFDDEKFAESYTRGTIAMANSGPNTNGSQFFIMHQDYQLPPNYVIFGRVSKGIEVVDAIAQAPVSTGFGGEQSKPVNPVKVTSISIVEK